MEKKMLQCLCRVRPKIKEIGALIYIQNVIYFYIITFKILNYYLINMHIHIIDVYTECSRFIIELIAEKLLP